MCHSLAPLLISSLCIRIGIKGYLLPLVDLIYSSLCKSALPKGRTNWNWCQSSFSSISCCHLTPQHVQTVKKKEEPSFNLLWSQRTDRGIVREQRFLCSTPIPIGYTEECPNLPLNQSCIPYLLGCSFFWGTKSCLTFSFPVIPYVNQCIQKDEIYKEKRLPNSCGNEPGRVRKEEETLYYIKAMPVRRNRFTWDLGVKGKGEVRGLSLRAHWVW